LQFASPTERLSSGKVYRFDGGTADQVVVYASFGALLVALSGSFRFLSNISAFGILAAERTRLIRRISCRSTDLPFDAQVESNAQLGTSADAMWVV
jgi:hypothetical protein